MRTARAPQWRGRCATTPANCDSSRHGRDARWSAPKAPNQDSSPIGAGRVERGAPVARAHRRHPARAVGPRRAGRSIRSTGERGAHDRVRMRLLEPARCASPQKTPPRPGSASSRGRCTPHCAQAQHRLRRLPAVARRGRAARRRRDAPRSSQSSRTTAIEKDQDLHQARGRPVQQDFEHEARADVGEQQQGGAGVEPARRPCGPRQPKARRPVSRPAKTSQPRTENTVLWSQRQPLREHSAEHDHRREDDEAGADEAEGQPLEAQQRQALRRRRAGAAARGASAARRG